MGCSSSQPAANVRDANRRLRPGVELGVDGERAKMKPGIRISGRNYVPDELSIEGSEAELSGHFLTSDNHNPVLPVSLAKQLEQLEDFKRAGVFRTEEEYNDAKRRIELENGAISAEDLTGAEAQAAQRLPLAGGNKGAAEATAGNTSKPHYERRSGRLQSKLIDFDSYSSSGEESSDDEIDEQLPTVAERRDERTHSSGAQQPHNTNIATNEEEVFSDHEPTREENFASPEDAMRTAPEDGDSSRQSLIDIDLEVEVSTVPQEKVAAPPNVSEREVRIERMDSVASRHSSSSSKSLLKRLSGGLSSSSSRSINKNSVAEPDSETVDLILMQETKQRTNSALETGDRTVENSSSSDSANSMNHKSSSATSDSASVERKRTKKKKTKKKKVGTKGKIKLKGKGTPVGESEVVSVLDTTENQNMSDAAQERNAIAVDLPEAPSDEPKLEERAVDALEVVQQPALE